MNALTPVMVAIALLAIGPSELRAALELPPVFTDGGVMQHGVPIPVWGWSDPNAEVVVELGDQSRETVADGEGAWRVTFDPLALRGPETLTLQIRAGAESVTIGDLLVGDVWLCSGQSNMQWSLTQSRNGDMEVAKADRPLIRLLTIEAAGRQTPPRTLEAAWSVCTPDTVRWFSAVGYHFGLELHERFDIPIGLIDNAWGGTPCEGWTPRGRLEGDPMYAALMERWRRIEATFDPEAENAKHRERLAGWEEARRVAESNGEPVPRKPRYVNKLTAGHRPGNIYNGRVAPIIPFPIKGVIWYQGEANSSRAYQYREMFPLMIRSWREAWGQGDFPFYWVQLADYQGERDEPGESAWAELREAQTLALDREPNTGQAVIIDLGEGNDIHPRNKREVALRLARLAMNDAYGVEGLDRNSPRLERASFDRGVATVLLSDVGGGLRSFDSNVVHGFALAGEDRVFHHATAQIVAPDRVEVSCEAVDSPVAVRYAWADNPRCNLVSSAGLPVTPFRSDDWPGVTHDAR